MKVSIVTAVLDSHEVVRRQILHYKRMNLPGDVEIIFMDDGSSPSLEGELKNLTIHRTYDTRYWSEHIARNSGAKIAKGDYLIMVDIDYILPKESIFAVLNFTGDKMNFKRKFGVLNENGELEYDKVILKEYGLLRKWRKVEYVSGHKSQFAMRRDLFLEMGGYREDLVGQAHPKGEGPGAKFSLAWRMLKKQTGEKKPTIFMFPVGKFCGHIDYNPFNLFHNLPR